MEWQRNCSCQFLAHFFLTINKAVIIKSDKLIKPAINVQQRSEPQHFAEPRADFPWTVSRQKHDHAIKTTTLTRSRFLCHPTRTGNTSESSKQIALITVWCSPEQMFKNEKLIRAYLIQCSFHGLVNSFWVVRGGRLKTHVCQWGCTIVQVAKDRSIKNLLCLKEKPQWAWAPAQPLKPILLSAHTSQTGVATLKNSTQRNRAVCTETRLTGQSHPKGGEWATSRRREREWQDSSRSSKHQSRAEMKELIWCGNEPDPLSSATPLQTM